jgi:anti-sigma factor RsiW
MNDIRNLEERITEAIDGLLSEQQLSVLEADLQSHPDLLAEYRMQMSGLPVRSSYADVQPDPFAVSRMRQKMRAASQDQWQYDAIRIFKRYVLASGVGVILFFMALHAIPGTSTDNDMIDDEISVMFESLEQDALSWSIIDNSTPTQK